MKHFTVAILLLFSLPLVFLSCKGNQNQADSKGQDKDSSSCNVEAKVIDYTGLSSCSILLELTDGTYLNPVDGYPRQEIHKAQIVKVSYTKIPDAMSSCMKGQLVNIICFEVIKKGTPTKGKFD